MQTLFCTKCGLQAVRAYNNCEGQPSGLPRAKGVVMSNNWAVINRAIRFASAGMSLDEAKALRDSLGKEFEVVTLSVARCLKQDILNPLSHKRWV